MFTLHQSPQKWHFRYQNKPRRHCLPSRIPIIQNVSNNQTADQNPDEPTASIRRLVLNKEGRTKLNNYPDREFYAFPRFVAHVDNNFISVLTDLYRQVLKPEMEILDLMSSWISHLPQEVSYKRVVGHGLNVQELARNPRLDYFFVKDLNKEQEIEMESGSLDAVLCTVSVQYLQQPEKVFAEVCRVLRPGGVFIVSFSNRMFYEKAIGAWRDGTGYSRVQLVVQYFQCVEGFTQPQVIRRLPNTQEDKSILSRITGLLGLLSGSDPFYAVLAYKNFKPVYE